MHECNMHDKIIVKIIFCKQNFNPWSTIRGKQTKNSLEECILI
jgi:hypothetical protein